LSALGEGAVAVVHADNTAATATIRDRIFWLRADLGEGGAGPQATSA